jgi:hypothetical protein
LKREYKCGYEISQLCKTENLCWPDLRELVYDIYMLHTGMPGSMAELLARWEKTTGPPPFPEEIEHYAKWKNRGLALKKWNSWLRYRILPRCGTVHASASMYLPPEETGVWK